MEMMQVRYFLALCKEGSFTRAARHCGVAQPSLTRAVRNLEHELGELLFERRPEGAKLTAFGDQVLPYFETIHRCVAEIKRKPRRVCASNRKTANEITRRLGLTGRANDSSFGDSGR
jgi:DNA-binding transcriptional LysR family regulator